MVQPVPAFLVAAKESRRTWRSIGCLVCLLTACDQSSVPPSPIDPGRPKTMATRQSEQMPVAPSVQKAVFTYARPGQAPSSSLQPKTADRECCRLQV